MKKKIFGYWAATGLVAFVMLTGGAANMSHVQQALDGLKHLGFPPWFGMMLGAWKIAGAIVLLAPRLPRLKEWAYAGILIDLTSASVSHAAAHDELWHVIAPIAIAGITLASWALRPEPRVLGKLFFQEA